ncbi:rRNA N6-adenosine-methyltransferase METTL5-like isoform X1 [Chelonus insularis]|nr:rRNA N6-adenosine-methyltransferase METTL5-like isoform X1 [Chelonus insularis]
MAGIRMKKLEYVLQQLDTFQKPKILLEQYSTSAHIGAHILYTAQTQFNDITNRTVADLGAGCGVLSLGAAMMNADYVVGFEIDPDALNILSANCHNIGLSVEAILCDVSQYLPGKFIKAFDTVIMNPPFGTKHNAGIDMKFLEIATKLANRAVYSLHKTSTREHVIKKGYQLKTEPTVIAELKYDIPRAYKFHKKNSIDVEVDFIRFSINL